MGYKAFISYSHSADERLAAALQSALQQFAKPYYAMRAFNVFRDQTDLSADPSLWARIEEALDSAEFFILLASPESANSYWVKREIDHWLKAHEGKPTHVLLLLTRGQIEWNVTDREFNWNTTNALPTVLNWDSANPTPKTMSGLFGDAPFYVDFRWASGKTELSLRDADFLDNVGTIAAELHGLSKNVLVGRDVTEHRRFRRLRVGAITALAVLAVTAAIFGFVAVLNARRAIRESEIARSQALAAESFRYRDSNPQRAALLAIAGNDVKPTIDSLGAILRIAYGERKPDFIDTPVITAFAISPAKAIFATGHENGTVHLQSVHRGDPTVLEGSSSKVSHLAFDSTGKYLAVVHTSLLSEDKSGDLLEVWNISEGKEVSRPISVLGRVSWIAVLSDGRTAVTLANTLGQSLLRTWNLNSGELTAGPVTFRGSVAALSPNSKLIGVVTSGESYGSAEMVHYLNLPDLVSVQKGAPLGSDASSVTAATFDREGAWFITGHSNGELRFSAAPGVAPVASASRVPPRAQLVGQDDSTRKNVLTGHTGAVTSLAVHPSGKILASGSDDGTIRLWHLQARRPLVPPSKPEYGVGTGFDPFTGAMVDSTQITSPDPHGEPVLRSFEPEETVYRWDRREMSVGFSSDGQYLLEASSTDGIQRWDVPIGKPVINNRRQPREADATDDGDLFAKTDGFSADVQSKDGSPVSRASLGGYVRQVMLDQHGKTLAAVGQLSVQVFDARNGRPISPVLSSGSAHAFSPDGGRLAIAGTDEAIRFFDARNGVLSGKVGTSIPGKPSSLIFAADSRSLFVGTSTGAIHEVAVPGGEDLGQFQQSGDSVSVLAVDCKGQWLAAADSRNHVSIWSVHSRNRVGPVTSVGTAETDGEILSLRFSHDGTKLAIGAEKLTARLLDVRSGQQIGPDFDTLQPAEAIAFTPDDAELHVFRRDLPPRTLLLSAQRLRPILGGMAGRNATWSEWEHFMSPEPYRRIFSEYNVHESYLQEARRRALDGRTDDALAMFRRADTIQPDLHLNATETVNQIQLVDQGQDRARAGDITGALAKFHRAQQLGWHPPEDPNRYADELAAQALTAEGVRFAEIDDVNQAVKKFTDALRAISNHPSSAQDYDGRIQRELAMAGANEYAKQVALQTLVEGARNSAGLGRVEDATEKLRAAGRYNPMYATDPGGQARAMAVAALTKEAGEWVARGDLDRARDLYARTQQINPSFDAGREFRRVLAGVKRGQVDSQAQSGYFETALKLIDEAQALDPLPPREVYKAKATARALAHKAEGDHLADEGRLQAAIAVYRAALAENPSLKLDPAREAKDRRITFLRSQASIALSKGDRDGAVNFLKLLLHFDPSLSMDHELILLTSPSPEANKDLLAYFSNANEKVFLFTPLGSWEWAGGYHTTGEAMSEAMSGGRARYGGQEAFVYMKNDTVVAPNAELNALRQILRARSGSQRSVSTVRSRVRPSEVASGPN